MLLGFKAGTPCFIRECSFEIGGGGANSVQNSCDKSHAEFT